MSSDTAPAEQGTGSLRLGAGLLAGLFLGRNSLAAAATGQEQFEIAIAHFILVVVVSLVGVAALAVTYERLSLPREDQGTTDEADAFGPNDSTSDSETQSDRFGDRTQPVVQDPAQLSAES